MPTAKSWPDGRLVMRKMPLRPLRVRTHAHSRVSVKESHNKTERDLAGSVLGMPELWQNQDCVFEGGCNRAEAVSCGCPKCQSARTGKPEESEACARADLSPDRWGVMNRLHR